MLLIRIVLFIWSYKISDACGYIFENKVENG